jgi:glycosyltransferase involved in cell wall biosynthesis
MPAISVIVPTLKRNHFLPRCLRSLYGQTFRDFEILLVDDNPAESRVASDPALNGLLGDTRLRLIENAVHRNAAAARNCGLREARGDWITYLDDDDAYCPRKLEKQFAKARETKTPLVSCGVTYHLPGRTRRYYTSRTQFVGDDLLLEFPGMPEVFHQRADVQFSEALSGTEDLYFYQELIGYFQTSAVYNIPEPLVDLYLHRGPRVSLNAEAVWQGALAVHRDFGPRYSSAAREVFLLRSRLAYCRVRGGALGELLKVSWRLAKLRGATDARTIAGAILYQIPPLRPFILR